MIQYIYQRYGRERAGLAAAVITYRTRSAIRETAKVFGLSDDVIAALNGTAWGQETDADRRGLVCARSGLIPPIRRSSLRSRWRRS